LKRVKVLTENATIILMEKMLSLMNNGLVKRAITIWGQILEFWDKINLFHVNSFYGS